MNFWRLLYKSSWAALAVLAMIGVASMFIPKWREYLEYQRRRDVAQEEIRLEEERFRELRSNQERFQSDPRFVEQMAHDLGMAKPGEVLFKFKEDETTNRPSGTVP